jgi:DNA-binding PadR family transcriptional regulator
VNNLSDTEIEVLAAAKMWHDYGVPETYGYLLAKTIEERWRSVGKHGWFGREAIIAHGTLHLALDRLIQKGYLTRHKEDEAISRAEGRPGRYYYRLVDPSRLPEETR